MPMSAIRELISSNGFMPHGVCYQWKPLLIWLHSLSDTLMAIAYLSLPLVLIPVARKKRNIPFDLMFVCFGIFIVACGASHFLEVVTVWIPVYWISNGVKAITALASVPTAILLARVIPQALELPGADELRCANEELKRQAAILREQAVLLDLSQDAILVQTIDGKNLLWNQGAERMYGWPKAEAIGQLNHELLQTNFSRRRNEIIEKFLTTGYWEGELQQSRRDGQRIMVSSRWALGRGLDGGPQTVLKIDTNITERKRAEKARRQSEELLRAAFEQAAVGFSMTDKRGRFVKVNEAYCRITGYSEDELLSMDFQSITYPEDGPSNLAQIQRLLNGEISTLVYHKRYIRKSGDLVWVQNSVSAVLDEDGAVSGLMALTEDITERKRAEDGLWKLSGRLLQLQDEERRKIARDLHDSTGQDLVAMSTTLGHLLATIPSSSRKLRKSVSQCQAVADRCIREIRTLSYLLHPPMLDEAGLEDAVRHYAAGFAERTGIEVELEVSPNFGRMWRETEMALFRVMQESLVNIHRHSGSFSARVRLDRSPWGVLLEVSDRGRGIPGKEQERINGHTVAAGVGIQSMHERMKQVGAELEIESSAKGTTVRATVPAHD